MEKNDALKILFLKSEQQVNMIELLNKQLDICNCEKQEMRMQLTAMNNDNLTLRRETEHFQFQIANYVKQNEILQQEVRSKSSLEQNTTEYQPHANQQNSPSTNQLLEKEYRKLSEENSNLRMLINEQKNQSQLYSMQIEAIKFDNEKAWSQIKHLESLVQQKDKYLLFNEQQLSSQQESFQKKNEELQRQLMEIKTTLLQQPHINQVEAESSLIQQYRDKYEQLKVEYENLQQQKGNYMNNELVSAERNINEMQISGGNQQHSVNNQGLQMKQSNDQSQQNTFQLKTVTSYPSMASQPKASASDRLRNSDYS